MKLGTRIGGWRVVALRQDGAPLVRRIDGSGDHHRLLTYDAPFEFHHAPHYRHAGFVRVIEATEHYWVLDDARATPLDGLLDDEPMSLDCAAAFARGMLLPLADLHGIEAQPQRHLTLQSVVVDPSGGVRLCPDLPNAHADAPTPVGATTWAPEQIRGLHPELLTHAVDVFAVGAILFRLLAGRWAHHGHTPVDTLRAVMDGRTVAPLGTLAPGLPPQLERAVERAIHPDIARRPRDAGALLGLLEPYLPDHATATAALLRRLARDETTPVVSLEPPPPPVVPPASDPHSTLPRALEPWRDALASFPEELALSLGTAVRRVARLLGRVHIDADATRGDPDGYRGITRRGPFERLLLSEWAFLLAVPDEFLRRAAMGEQLFTALAHKQPGGTRRAVALFDGGPESLGRPRIAQLAILIALAARARSADLPFAWGTLQDDRRALIAELNAFGVLRWLRGRSLDSTSAVDGTEWSIAIGEPASADDLWLIGPPSLDALETLSGGTRLHIEDGEDPVTRTVRLTVLRPGTPSRRLDLELPPEDDCARLIREPFQRRATAPARDAGEVVRMWFEPSGRRLIEQTDDGSVSCTYIPRSARETVPAVVHRGASADVVIVGASVARHRLFTVETFDGELRVQRVGAASGPSIRWSITVPPEAFTRLFDGRVAKVRLQCSGTTLRRLHLLDADGGLWRGEPDGVLESVATSVVDAYEVGGALLYAAVQEPGRLRLLRTIDSRVELIGEWECDDRPTMVLGVGAAAMPEPGVAVRVADGTWLYPQRHEPRILVPGNVVAVTHDDGHQALVVLEEDDRTLSLARTGSRRAFYTSAEPLRLTAPNPRLGVLACQDVRGGLRVVDLRGRVQYARD